MSISIPLCPLYTNVAIDSHINCNVCQQYTTSWTGIRLYNNLPYNINFLWYGTVSGSDTMSHWGVFAYSNIRGEFISQSGNPASFSYSGILLPSEEVDFTIDAGEYPVGYLTVSQTIFIYP
jgi:hypothetical protein